MNQSTCAASELLCLCTDKTFFTQATGCTTLQCGVKEGLCERFCYLEGVFRELTGYSTAATNLTMTACQVPQESQARTSSILAGVLGMLTLILVALRLVQRFLRNRLFGFDDGLIVAALICAAPLNCLMFPCKLELTILGFKINTVQCRKMDWGLISGRSPSTISRSSFR